SPIRGALHAVLSSSDSRRQTVIMLRSAASAGATRIAGVNHGLGASGSCRLDGRFHGVAVRGHTPHFQSPRNHQKVLSKVTATGGGVAPVQSRRSGGACPGRQPAPWQSLREGGGGDYRGVLGGERAGSAGPGIS